MIGGGLAGLGGLLLFPSQLLARRAVPNDSFVVLLKGLYQPVVRGPNLGLSVVDLNDGSYSTTSIYPVSGTPGNQNQNKAVGTFYVQFDGDLCAYHVPGGSFAMRFTGSDFVFVDDGAGGQFLEGTFELTILAGDGGLPTVCRRSQPHGRQAALPGRWRRQRILLLLHQPSVTALGISLEDCANAPYESSGQLVREFQGPCLADREPDQAPDGSEIDLDVWFRRLGGEVARAAPRDHWSKTGRIRHGGRSAWA